MTTFQILILICFVLLILAAVCYGVPAALGVASIGAFFGGYDGGKRKITMFTREPWISEIIDGTKTVEGRLGKLENFADWKGKRITILGGGKKVKAIIDDLKQYKSLEDYVAGEKFKKVSPHAANEAAAINELLELTKKSGDKIYTKETIAAAGGIVAIRFTVENESEKKSAAKKKAEK